MEQVQIRAGGNSDWENLDKIFCSNRSKEAAWLNPTRPPDDLRKECEGETILVAEKVGKILGFISIWEPENFIHHLHIDLKFQKMGIGRKLVVEAQRRYSGQLKLKCVERNTEALEFYFRTGWKEVGRGESDDGIYLLLELES